MADFVAPKEVGEEVATATGGEASSVDGGANNSLGNSDNSASESSVSNSSSSSSSNSSSSSSSSSGGGAAGTEKKIISNVVVAVNPASPLVVNYCKVCGLPLEYCENGDRYEECLNYLLTNSADLLTSAQLAKLEEGTGEEEEGKKKKRGGGAGPKKAEVVETKVIISRQQMQKKKYQTTAEGLETIPGIKLKDAAKLFGKKFAAGAALKDDNQVIVQGDILDTLPAFLVKEYKISGKCIFLKNDGDLTPYEL